MPAIIRMKSSEFLGKFCKEFNYKTFNFILVSSDIKTKRKHSNVYSIPALMPPTKALTRWFNDKNWKEYYELYYKHLATGSIEMYITTIVKLCVMENVNVVLLCSDDEDEYKYLKGLCNYIEHIYGAETYSFKTYRRNPKKCDSASNKKETMKIIKKKIKAYQDFNVTPEVIEISKKEMKTRLKAMDKDTLIRICKKNGLNYKKKTRSELIRLIIKHRK